MSTPPSDQSPPTDQSPTSDQSPPPDQSPSEPRPTYEQAREELVQVVQKLESGGAPLDESLALWERGEKLAQICQQWLDGAKAKVEQTRAPDSDA